MISDSHSSNERSHAARHLAALAVLVALILGVVPAFAMNDSIIPLGSSFNSSFNGSKAGWSPAHGVWKLMSTGKYKGVAEDAVFVSAKHKDAYLDFMFKVRMKRVGPGATGILFRGVATTVPAQDHLWESGYGAFYDNGGLVALMEITGGVPLPLALSAVPVLPDQWNTLGVVAYADALGVYLNGDLLGVLHDNTYEFGSVGIGFLDEDPPNHLLVDWAKLTVISGDTDPFARDFSTFKIQGDDRVLSPYEALGR